VKQPAVVKAAVVTPCLATRLLVSSEAKAEADSCYNKPTYKTAKSIEETREAPKQETLHQAGSSARLWLPSAPPSEEIKPGCYVNWLPSDQPSKAQVAQPMRQGTAQQPTHGLTPQRHAQWLDILPPFGQMAAHHEHHVPMAKDCHGNQMYLINVPNITVNIRVDIDM
jgi:hypothetical protein